MQNRLYDPGEVPYSGNQGELTEELTPAFSPDAAAPLDFAPFVDLDRYPAIVDHDLVVTMPPTYPTFPLHQSPLPSCDAAPFAAANGLHPSQPVRHDSHFDPPLEGSYYPYPSHSDHTPSLVDDSPPATPELGSLSRHRVVPKPQSDRPLGTIPRPGSSDGLQAFSTEDQERKDGVTNRKRKTPGTRLDIPPVTANAQAQAHQYIDSTATSRRRSRANTEEERREQLREKNRISKRQQRERQAAHLAEVEAKLAEQEETIEMLQQDVKAKEEVIAMLWAQLQAGGGGAHR
jgi:hypothetical protein